MSVLGVFNHGILVGCKDRCGSNMLLQVKLDEKEGKIEDDDFKENIEELAKKMTSVSVFDRAGEEAKVSSQSESKAVGVSITENKQSVPDTTPTSSKSSDLMEEEGGAGGAEGGARGNVGGARSDVGGIGEAVGGARVDVVGTGEAVGGARGDVVGAGEAVGGARVNVCGGGQAGAPIDDMMGAVGGADNLLQALSIAQMLEDMGHQQMFAVQPLSWCPHLETVQPLSQRFLDTRAPCQDCGNEGENWVCLVCYKVYCSRYVNEHMVIHGVTEQHLVTLSFSDLSVWCYGCDNYIDNQIVAEAKRAAHRHKFGSEMSGS
ncbi:histone deacetylase 6-like [Ylistrum balloti]|uniref:histone deacetylase 6-like n=1 Tax=Ylistrum balloti TaxID=509963 RepID=UPI002905B31E|nr:histone deacetylase 6-like [Ylistrum balloti]